MSKTSQQENNSALENRNYLSEVKLSCSYGLTETGTVWLYKRENQRLKQCDKVFLVSGRKKTNTTTTPEAEILPYMTCLPFWMSESLKGRKSFF